MSNPTDLSTKTIGHVPDESVWEQVERLMGSQALRNSETQRRLLRYLTEKSISGEADQLKEYTIGMDLFGKGAEYDPRQDSGVRIQVGRLRAKLAEYYSSDGVHDAIIISLPRGRFKLLFEERSHAAPTPDVVESSVDVSDESTKTVPAIWRTAAYVLSVGLIIVLVWWSWSSFESRTARQSPTDASWTPAMQEFWAPFVEANRPLLIVVGTPLFVGLKGVGFYRDMNKNQWDDVTSDPNLKAIRKSLNSPEIVPVHTYTGFGEAKSAGLLGMLLVQHTHNIQYVRSIDASWQQISESNVIILGGGKTFGETIRSLPAKSELTLDSRGLHILSGANGAPEFVRDEMIGGAGSGLSSVPDEGTINAVIGILPGPNGKGFVGTFLSSLSSGVLAAVQYASDPANLRELTDKLRDRSGHIPRYFQVALQVTVKGGAPINSRYLMHREVHLDSNAVGK